MIFKKADTLSCREFHVESESHKFFKFCIMDCREKLIFLISTYSKVEILRNIQNSIKNLFFMFIKKSDTLSYREFHGESESLKKIYFCII